MSDDGKEHANYFWTGWFDGQSFALLAFVFCLLSLVDLLATLQLMPAGIREGNWLADFVLKHYQIIGFVALKIFMVAIVLLCTWVVDRRNARLSRLVLWGGCLIMGLIALRHLAIMVGLTLPS